ncbi:hypothetical protein M9458_038017, partial [Cirrhinus mrigala]
PIVVPFIHDHHLMLQHDNARPHVAPRICTQFLEAENIPVSAWPAYSPDILGMLWIGVYDSVFQGVDPNIPQATINNLINSMQRRCVALREANGGHTKY